MPTKTRIEPKIIIACGHRLTIATLPNSLAFSPIHRPYPEVELQLAGQFR